MTHSQLPTPGIEREIPHHESKPLATTLYDAVLEELDFLLLLLHKLFLTNSLHTKIELYVAIAGTEPRGFR